MCAGKIRLSPAGIPARIRPTRTPTGPVPIVRNPLETGRSTVHSLPTDRRRIVLSALILALPGLTLACAAGEPVVESGAWTTSPAEETRPLFTTDFEPAEFAARRAAVYDAIGPDAIAVLQGAPSPEGFVRFRQTNEFYYLSGIETPHAYLILDGPERRTTLYLPNRNERREYNEGKVLSAEDADLVKELAGVDAVYSTDVLVDHLRGYARSGRVRTVYTLSTPPEGLSATRGMTTRAHGDWREDPLDGRQGRQEIFNANLRRHLPGLATGDLTPIIDNLRLVKSEAELKQIRTSSRLQGLAIMEAIRSTTPGITEYELEAIGKYIFWQHGVQGDGYYSLSHIGPNAYMNHYHAGVRAAEPGDMILMDYGGDYRYYVSDMARMWPASGRFNSVQRELYGFYLAFYEAILYNIRPGLTAQQVKLAALEEIEPMLEGWTFSSPAHEEAARAFVESFRAGAQNPNATLGHWVGMAAHDPGRDTGVLRPGMVLTIEPQFRVPEEKIYIRLEDTIAITEDGVEIMTDFVPRDIEGIERLMREEGLLQQFPRLLDDAGEFLAPATAMINGAKGGFSSRTVPNIPDG